MAPWAREGRDGIEPEQVRPGPLARLDGDERERLERPAEPAARRARAAGERGDLPPLAREQRHDPIGLAVVDGPQDERGELHRGHRSAPPREDRLARVPRRARGEAGLRDSARPSTPAQTRIMSGGSELRGQPPCRESRRAMRGGRCPVTARRRRRRRRGPPAAQLSSASAAAQSATGERGRGPGSARRSPAASATAARPARRPRRPPRTGARPRRRPARPRRRSVPAPGDPGGRAATTTPRRPRALAAAAACAAPRRTRRAPRRQPGVSFWRA